MQPSMAFYNSIFKAVPVLYVRCVCLKNKIIFPYLQSPISGKKLLDLFLNTSYLTPHPGKVRETPFSHGAFSLHANHQSTSIWKNYILTRLIHIQYTCNSLYYRYQKVSLKKRCLEVRLPLETSSGLVALYAYPLFISTFLLDIIYSSTSHSPPSTGTIRGYV